MTLKTAMLRKAGIGLTAGEKAANTKRAAGTLYAIAQKAAATKRAQA
jgi:hypothetical protein